MLTYQKLSGTAFSYPYLSSYSVTFWLLSSIKYKVNLSHSINTKMEKALVCKQSFNKLVFKHTYSISNSLMIRRTSFLQSANTQYRKEFQPSLTCGQEQYFSNVNKIKLIAYSIFGMINLDEIGISHMRLRNLIFYYYSVIVLLPKHTFKSFLLQDSLFMKLSSRLSVDGILIFLYRWCYLKFF